MLTVADVMEARPVVVQAQTALAQAAALMQSRGCSDLMVVDEQGQFRGVVSEGDVLRACLPAYHELGGRSMLGADDLLESRAAEVAHRTVEPMILQGAVRLAPSDGLLRAAAVMASMQIRRLPVVDANGRLLGTLSRGDLLTGLFGSGQPAAPT